MAEKSGDQGYGLLISAVVAIVAIVGQVILFNSSGSTGLLVEMSGPVEPYPYAGLGQAYARGARAGRDAGGGVSYYDYETDSYSAGSQGSFGSGVSAADTNRYSGYQDEPHAYFGEEGGMYADDQSTEESFNRGEYGKGYRQGIDRTTLPTSRGSELG